MKILKMRISHCVQCPYHKIESDPDRFDSFNYDDVKLVCTKKRGGRDIAVALRPYEVKQEAIPKWCPLPNS